MTNQITVIIHTFNEEKHIAEAVESAHLLAPIVIVVDMESSDKTVAIAKTRGSQVYSFPHHSYVEPAREFGVQKVQTDWIFLLDADERITQELAQEIQKSVKDNKFTFYKVPRKNIFAGKKWLRHGGWYPDLVIRLIKKDAFVRWPTMIHSTPVINGEVGYLSNPLIHNFHPNLENMVYKTIIYESIEADLLYKAEKKSGTAIFFRKYFGELYRRLLRKMGFLDGVFGVIESLYQAYSKTITYLILYEKQKTSRLV